jgi:hypothetical protein
LTTQVWKSYNLENRLYAFQTKLLKIAGLEDFNLVNKIEIFQTKCFDNTGLEELQPIKQVVRLPDQAIR